ncbi:MAG: hypothetical protein ACREFD_19060 [Stellaceae bacterium]
MDRKIAMRNPLQNRLEFGGESVLIAGTHATKIGGVGEIERPDHTVDVWDRDLKPHPFGDQALFAQRLEDKIGIGGILGIAETIAPLPLKLGDQYASNRKLEPRKEQCGVLVLDARTRGQRS